MYCWGKPSSSKSFHIFHDMRSLCMKWMYSSADQPVQDGIQVANSGDCKACVNVLNKLLETKKPNGKKT